MSIDVSLSCQRDTFRKHSQLKAVYAGRTDLCKHCTTDLARGIMKLGIPQLPHYPIAEVLFHINSLDVKGRAFQTF